MTILYGIKNCDTVKKARAWLDQQGVTYTYHDVRVDGLNFKKVQGWIDALGTETVINKRSTTWKRLSGEDQQKALSTGAAAVIMANPTLLKRPVLETDSQTSVGFDADEYQTLFNV